MKRIFPIFCAMIITLCACSVKETAPLECVNDTLTEIHPPAYYLTADYPADAALVASCNDGCCALLTGDHYEICQEIFPAESLEAAVSYLTGRTEAELNPIRLRSFPYEEYRFAYTAAGETEFLTYSGKLFYDGTFCYALTVSYPVFNENKDTEKFNDLISSVRMNAV